MALAFGRADAQTILGYLADDVNWDNSGVASKQHVWTFNNHGQVSAYRHFNDTAMELAAWRS